jgi:hypothetical protein
MNNKTKTMKKIKIEIKNRWTGKILFEYESENNTVKQTLIKAVEQDADLRGAYLQGAYLRGAYLRGAYLRDADLRGADLRDADLRDADLRDAYLRDADLRGAYLQGAYLRDAYLRGADLRGAYLQGADYKKIKHQFQIIPEEGSFIAWKKLSQGCIAKLEIPSRAKRVCNTLNRKCRASMVKTLEIYDRNMNPIKEMNGSHDCSTVYKVGRLTKPDKFDKTPFKDCTNGIHFFVTKQEALNW